MTPDATRRSEERAPEGEQIDDQTTAVRAGGYMDSNGFRQQFSNIADACALAQAIVDTVQEPLLVFDRELRVISRKPLVLFGFQSQPAGYPGAAA
jgi:hypothetical protein